MALWGLTACQPSEERFNHSNISDRCDQLISSVGALSAYKVCLNDARKNVPEAQFALARAFESGALGVENKDHAIFWYERAAKKKYPPAQFKLAQHFLKIKNVDKAIKLLESSAQKSNIDSQLLLGKLFYEGNVIKKNKTKAKKWLEGAASAQNGEAQYLLSKFYALETKDDKKSDYWLKSSAKLNFSQAIEEISEQFIKTGQYDKAGQWLVKGSRIGSHRSQYLLAKLVLDKKVPWNLDVTGLLTRSQDYIPSKVLLAKCYLDSTIAPQDVQKARMLLLEASKAGSPEADYEIGLAYLKGSHGWEKNFQEGAYFIKKSAANDYKPANIMLATLFMNGQPLLGDKQEALMHLALMAVDGEVDAQYKLALLLKDFGIPLYDRIAFHWLEKAAEFNFSDAKYLLAQFYQDGIGTEINYDKSFLLYQEMASQHYPDAFLALARFYHYGWGTTADPLKAKQWLTLAIDANAADAKKVAREIFASNEVENFDETTSYQLLDFAVESEVPSALYIIGKRYFEGATGYIKNINTGFSMLLKAANQSYVLAQRELGIIFEYGLYEHRDLAQAMLWYEKAAMQGDGFSQFRLAQLYYDDASIEDNMIQAYVWANLASMTGMLPAEELRDNIFDELTPSELEQSEALEIKILSNYQTDYVEDSYESMIPEMPFEVESAHYH